MDAVLRAGEIGQILQSTGRATVVNWIREAIASIRQTQPRILMKATERDFLEYSIELVVRKWHSTTKERMQEVINATGVLLHTNLGRAPLAERAISRMQKASRYTNVEMNLESGNRSQRSRNLCSMLADLVGAEDALIVNNCAAATVLALQGLALGKEVVISRSQLVEIGGGFRLPDVFRSAGVSLRDVGTTNRTYIHDYENALNGDTGAIIRVHRSNFFQSGFTAEPTLAELVSLCHRRSIPFIDDIGSGLLYDLSAYGLDDPNVRNSVAAGSDVILFSGDKLFGGPQAGIIVGKQEFIEVLRRSPLARAMRLDKVTLAAMEATVELHAEDRAWDDIPFYCMLRETVERLRARCEAILQGLTHSNAIEWSVTSLQSTIGGGTLPGQTLPSVGIQIRCESPKEFCRRLRLFETPIIGRIENELVLLDLRAVPSEYDATLCEGLRSVIASFEKC